MDIMVKPETMCDPFGSHKHLIRDLYTRFPYHPQVNLAAVVLVDVKVLLLDRNTVFTQDFNSFQTSGLVNCDSINYAMGNPQISLVFVPFKFQQPLHYRYCIGFMEMSHCHSIDIDPFGVEPSQAGNVEAEWADVDLIRSTCYHIRVSIQYGIQALYRT